MQFIAQQDTEVSVLEVTIRHTSNVLTSDAKELFAEAIAQGMLASIDHQFLSSVANSSAAFYAATDKGEVIGLITYTVLEFAEAAKITLIYVEPSSRKLGVFGMLFKEAKAYLERYGCTELFVDVPAEDEVLADILDKQGSIATYRYVIDLGETGAENGKLLGPTD
ncbi:N-acyltransferase protein [Rhizobium phage RHph_TM16]|nr:N-acyltransferase protein [Rhizobium phage RHph_TM16]